MRKDVSKTNTIRTIKKNRCKVCNVLIRNGSKFCKPDADVRMMERQRISQRSTQFNKNS